MTTAETTIFDGALEDVFYVPGKDPGISLLEKPDWYWRSRKGGRIRGINLSTDEEDKARLDKQIAQFEASRFDPVVEFNTLPVVLSDATFFKQFMSVGGKWMLNGSAGDRFSLAHYLHHRRERENLRAQAAYEEFIQATGRGRVAEPLPVWTGSPQDLDYTIDCRNLHNYYHFMSETLSQIATLLKTDFGGRILLHTGTSQVKGFALRAIEEIFPDHVDKLVLIDDREEAHSYPQAIGALHFRRMYLQFTEDNVPDPHHHEAFPELWKMREGKRLEILMLPHNSCNAPVRHLRDAAYAKLDAQGGFDHLPRKFWVGRKSSNSLRDRTPEGTEDLIRELARHGFDQVYFEDLTQLEQVAIMRNAEAMVTVHGAGVANMMFAAPSTHVYELSNADCGGGRWKHFVSLAHSAECAHSVLFCDKAATEHGLAPVALRGDTTDKILHLMDEDGSL